MTSTSNIPANSSSNKTQESLIKFINSLDEGFELLELIFDHQGNIVDFVFLEVNPAYERQTGLKAADIIGKRKKEVAPASEQKWYDKAIEAAKTGITQIYQYYNEKVNGTFETQFMPISANQIAVLFKDITERKKAEDESKRNSQRINEILESISDDFMVLDQNWNYIYANSQAAKLVGLESKEIVGKNFWELFPQNKGTYIEQNLHEAMEKREIRRFELLGQYSHKYKLISTYPSVEGIVLIATDITERKALEKQLQERERLAVIGQTAGMVGHDIRNPLQAIVSELFLAKQVMAEVPKNKDITDALESIDLIQEQIDYINKIVSDLQDYARPLKPEYTDVNVENFLVKVFETIAIPDKVKLKVNVQGVVRVKTDATFIQRSIINLVNNGIQAMPNGGELELTAFSNEKSVVITVADTGEGIPENVKPNLFKPLTTTKAKGQGLGLAVVKRLIEGLNGRVTFESEKGKGTKFIIELPSVKE